MSDQKQLLHEIAQPILVAEVYIFHDNALLMIKRSQTKKKFPGFWSIPGGHIEAGEDPLAAAIREVQEETGVTIRSQDIDLKVVALHHHLDRGEIYTAFAFTVCLPQRPAQLIDSSEGTIHWVEIEQALTMEHVFPPIKYYFKRILNDQPGIMYNYSQWENNQLVKVLSETVDADVDVPV